MSPRHDRGQRDDFQAVDGVYTGRGSVLEHVGGDGQRIDGNRVGRPAHDGRSVREALGMRSVSRIEGGLPEGSDLFDTPEEYIRGSEERKPRMLMMVVVPS